MTACAPEPTPSPSTESVARLSLAQLQDALGTGELSPTDLSETLIRRAGELDTAGPQLASLILIDPDLPARADALGAAPGPQRPALWGIPVAVKDTLDTQGLATTAGSRALAGAQPPDHDAVCVARLRAAGALVAAKANLSEWSNFRGRQSSSGWSAVGGQTRNPYALRRSPGGSSAGSAAAVAAGLVVAAIGSETDGSILCPAALCGVVGLKPTVGRIPRTGAIPVAASQDSLGVLARDVLTAAQVLAAVSGPDAGDPASLAAPPLGATPTQPAALAGLRLGVLRSGFFGYSRHADRLVEAVLAELAAAGVTVLDPADVTPGEPGRPAPVVVPGEEEMTVLLHECRAGLDAYLPTRTGGPRSVAELVAFNRDHAADELALFGQELLEQAAELDLRSPRYQQAWQACAPVVRTSLDRLFDGHRLDALVAPTMGPAWLIDHVNGDMATGSSYSPAAVAGYPSMSVPVGLADGLPVGLMLTGRPWGETALLSVALSVERLAGRLPAPTFQPG